MCGPGPPVGALPRYLAFLSSSYTPPLTTGPCCFPAPLVSRTASPAPRRPPLFTSPPSPQVRAAAFDHAARNHPSPTSTLWAAAPEALSLSRFPSSTRHRADHPPPISLSCSPSRARRFGEAAGASLRSVPRPHPSSSSPPSPLPTHLPHRLPPLETPPPLWFLPEYHRCPPLSVSTTTCSPSIQMDSPLTFPCTTGPHHRCHPPPEQPRRR
jgi:hypothetical protein